jgi:hypothetical protein
MLVSIYGTDLGPRAGCIGQADTKKRETPSPLRPDQAFVETLIYATELCSVQVMFGETPSGLLYVQDGQINFKVPQDAPMDGPAPVRVVYQGRSSAAVKMRLGLEVATLSLEQPAHVGGPVWVRIQAPPFPWYGDVQFPSEFTRPISAVTRWKYGATVRCSPEFRCGPQAESPTA